MASPQIHKSHQMQHPASPTWCIHCGVFDPYCALPCDGAQDGRFDASKPAVWDRMAADMFGWPKQEAQRG